MKFNDILALAKNGYSPKDIKDLMSLATDNEDPAEEDQEKKVAHPAEPKDQKEDRSEADHEQELLYTNKISELEAKNKELEDQIKAIQRQNTTKPLPEKEDTTDKDIDDLFRSFM